jgi:hypothetical protein
MSIFNRIGDIHGCNHYHQSSINGHLRPAHNDFGSVNVVRFSVLGDVGTTMGPRSNTSNICNLQLSCDKHKGKETT